MVEDLKGDETKVEGGKPTLEKGEKPTIPEAKPTLKTYSQKELDEAVGKGRASTQSKLSLSQAESKKLQAEIERYKTENASQKAYTESLRKEVEEALADDPERKQAYTNRLAHLEREQELAKREQEAENKLYEAELKGYDLRMASKANEVIAKYGIPLDQLKDATTEEELELRGVNYKLAQLETKAPKKEEKPPKFESGISSGGGTPSHPSMDQLDKMTPEEYAKWYKTRKNSGRLSYTVV